MNIAVIGLGFVGLTTALGFCEKDFNVTGYEIDDKKLNMFVSKEIPFYEPFLKEKLNKYLGNKFRIYTNMKEVLSEAETIFFCVGTPQSENGDAILDYLFNAIGESLLNINIKSFKVLIIKSTIPPSTTKDIIKPYLEKKGVVIGKDIGLANNPEFLREGYAWDDFINPDRIIIGVEDKQSESIIKKVYEKFDAPLYAVSYNTGEFIKYLSNTLLSTLISYSNEMSIIADLIGGIDIPKSFKILHMDKRWCGSPAGMSSYVYPGCGYGGYCLPKDTSALACLSRKKGYEPNMLKSNLIINDYIKKYYVKKINKENKKTKKIGILGLSFKPDSDDVRLCPAFDIISLLKNEGFKNINAFDPISNEIFKNAYQKLNINYFNSLDAIVGVSDILVIVTGWQEFKEKQYMFKNKKVYDLRYVL